jgi:alkanesulfonate monooxygenase SsuD/methylene tetrahydromethanopterin reductase-like flavin-dependent oxidoreductase (luciferase family)
VIRQIKIGVHLRPSGPGDYAVWRDTVRRAEDLGADLILGNDQVQHPTVSRAGTAVRMLTNAKDLNYFEGWTALASWGEITNRAEIGFFVTGIGYRSVDQLADMAHTVDSISGGRLVFGIGDNVRGPVISRYGVDYSRYGHDSATSQLNRLEAALQHLELRLSDPLHPQARAIPIMMTGSGGPRVMRLVARHAQTWHGSADLEVFRRDNALLKTAMDELSRDPTQIARSAVWTGPARAETLFAEGVRTFVAEVQTTLGRHDLTVLEDMATWRDSRRSSKAVGIRSI